ncbi:exocyst complex component 2-like [Scleropages formosus]|uniref:Exocyst complex component 2 n=1 Tax=Scleropages formosus TaxID=113540 RepID=A0A0P7VNY4_SCLFO|nr:exocyst complex component 2-like [Scleropages formosus]
MSRTRQPPLVTGISPNEGIPWTKVTIRGENLGTGPADLIGLSICGHNCLLTAQWMSASKIVCRVGPAKDDKGEIIVTTRSGGNGTSTVSFKLLKTEKIGILDQSAVWVDEMNYYDMRTDKNKSISPLSLRPANPLGIEIDKWVELHPKCQGKVPQVDLESMFPGMSGDITSENFSATWYLIENHSATSFDQLRVAANNLRKQANKKNEGSLAYVKGGLSTFFEAQDALAAEHMPPGRSLARKQPDFCFGKLERNGTLGDNSVQAKANNPAIHQKLEVDGTEKVGGSMTQKLENILNRASDTADTLFQEVLGRKDKADSTRNALNVLQRFKFLFNLPLNIERNIQKGDYDVVINDYEKAKSLFGNTEVQVFKKVYAEVETRIGALRSLLLDKLLETPSTLHDQKRYIRWRRWRRSPTVLFKSSLWVVRPWAPVPAVCRKTPSKVYQGSRGSRTKEPGTAGGTHSTTLDAEGDHRTSAVGRLAQADRLNRGGGFQAPRGESWPFQGPQQVAFVEKLTDVVINQLPNFWKLWISYVNGSLFSEKMIEEVTHRLVKLVRGALLPSSLTEAELRLYGGWEAGSELTGPWLTQVIQDLLLDLRVHCLLVTLQQTAEDIKRLAEKEDWVVDNEGITSLPAQFEQSMVQMLQSLKGPTECKPGEVNIFQLERTQDKASELCMTIMKVFINCLEQLSTKTDGDIDTSHISVDIASPDLFSSVHEHFHPTPEQRLLLILSNCSYLEKHTFLNLAEHLERHGFLGTEKITRVSMDLVRALDQRLFESYVERKADPIVGSLEPGMYAGYFDWRDCSPPTGVRNYLKEALVNIITVHAEVFAVSKELVPRVLSCIVESVAEEMSRLMQCVSSFSRNGALQARLEICVLRDALQLYLTTESNTSFKQALEALPQLHNGADKKLLEELLNKFKSSMHLQLTCFQPASVLPVKR